MDLQEELKEQAKNIDTKYLVMSLREIMSMYEDEELIINPIYQRNFRWDTREKSLLIESILLDFPLPPIFVYQREDGIWELVDGLQRVSTILEFFEKLSPDLINEKNKFDALESGIFLKNLKGITIKKFHDNYKDLVIKLKKYPIHVVIIDAKENGENNSKFEYEVFRRLNTYGARLSKQEIRNVTLALRNKDSYKELDNFVKSDNFKYVFSFSNAFSDERKDLEVILQFYMLNKIENYKKDLEKAYDLYDVLDDISTTISFEDIKEILAKMSDFILFIKDIVGEKNYSFKAYEKGKFTKVFQNHIFEIITLLYFKDKNKINLNFIKEIPSYTKWRSERKISNVKGNRRVLEVLKYVESL